MDNFHRECRAIVYTYTRRRSRRGYYAELSAHLSSSLLLGPSWKFRAGATRAEDERQNDEEEEKKKEEKKEEEDENGGMV